MWHLKNKINDRTKQNQTHGEQTDGHQMGGGGGGSGPRGRRRIATGTCGSAPADELVTLEHGVGSRGQGRPPAASTNVYPRGRTPGRGLISDANCT